MTTAKPAVPVRLGLRENLPQFILLVAINALVGGMIGQERTVLPLLADEVFAVGAFASSMTFIIAFGITKALTNLPRVPCPTGTAESPFWSPAG